jgi:hypothetical protein
MAWVRIPAVLEESESAQGVGGNPSVRVSSGGVSAMLCSATEELAEGLNGAPTANRGTNSESRHQQRIEAPTEELTEDLTGRLIETGRGPSRGCHWGLD